MDKTSLLTPFYFEAAVQRELILVCDSIDDSFDRRKFIVEVVVISEELNFFDVVIDFRDLESSLDALLKPINESFLVDFGNKEIINLISKLAENLINEIPAPSRLMEINFTDILNGYSLALRF